MKIKKYPSDIFLRSSFRKLPHLQSRLENVTRGHEQIFVFVTEKNTKHARNETHDKRPTRPSKKLETCEITGKTRSIKQNRVNSFFMPRPFLGESVFQTLPTHFQGAVYAREPPLVPPLVPPFRVPSARLLCLSVSVDVSAVDDDLDSLHGVITASFGVRCPARTWGRAGSSRRRLSTREDNRICSPRRRPRHVPWKAGCRFARATTVTGSETTTPQIYT